MKNRYKEAKKFKLHKQKASDCWRVSLSNYLQIPPKKIPDFVNEFPKDWVKATRDWLTKKYNKTIVYITSEVMETNEYNKLPHPPGKCIVQIKDNLDVDYTHAIFMFNGLLLQRHAIEKYDKVLGYFIIYDL
jgi:hypothetical protein